MPKTYEEREHDLRAGLVKAEERLARANLRAREAQAEVEVSVAFRDQCASLLKEHLRWVRKNEYVVE